MFKFKASDAKFYLFGDIKSCDWTVYVADSAENLIDYLTKNQYLDFAQELIASLKQQNYKLLSSNTNFLMEDGEEIELSDLIFPDNEGYIQIGEIIADF